MLELRWGKCCRYKGSAFVTATPGKCAAHASLRRGRRSMRRWKYSWKYCP
jgi:hypothetical protein